MSRIPSGATGLPGAAGLQKSAGEIERDAKGSSESLRALLKVQPPWSREIESQRQRTRNLYLMLLLAHPLSPHAQSLEPLWQSTTYILISSYRDAIARAEASIPPNRKKGNGNRMGDPEYRKSITRFRQALASEEAFYRGLIGRIVGFYQLQDLTLGHLGDLGIPLPEKVDGGGPDLGLAPIQGDEAKDKLGLVYKVLICLGDIERYKEQYSDTYKNKDRVRSKAGEEVFGKASAYYEVARGLMPDDGSAFNQLAVISTYLADDFQTTYYYFRALAVKSPFRNGEEIFDRFLTKLFERWRAQEHHEGDIDEAGRCKKEVLVITSIVFRRSGLSQLRKLFGSALPALRSLLAARQLPSEIIVKLVCISIGTHWHARHSSSLSSNGVAPDGKRVRDAEQAAVDFLLGIGTALFDVASQELREAAASKESAVMDDEAEESLYSLISAVLRRLLPALRIMSKWLKLHMDYLSRLTDNQKIQTFWKAYDKAITHFSGLFPIDQLPGLLNQLEEDVDMRGFIPLSRGMNVSEGLAADPGEESHVVHPNEEQLMRIADLQVDASLVAQIRSGGGRSALPFGVGALPFIPKARRGTEEDVASVSTQTEDDPVNLAMRATLAEESVNGDIDEEEIILWNPTATRAHPPPTSHAVPPVPAASAYDLLQNLVLESSTVRTPPKASSPHLGQQTAPGGSPGLLFGGDSSNIWRMTREESEKGLQRSSISETKAREEAAQKEAIKAIWNDPISPPVSAPAPSAHPGGGMKTSTTTSVPGSTMTTPKIAAPIVSPMSGTSAWAVNDAASLYAGLSSGWTPPTFAPHPPQAAFGTQGDAFSPAAVPRAVNSNWTGQGMDLPPGQKRYGAQPPIGYQAAQTYTQWNQAHGPS